MQFTTHVSLVLSPDLKFVGKKLLKFILSQLSLAFNTTDGFLDLDVFRFNSTSLTYDYKLFYKLSSATREELITGYFSVFIDSCVSCVVMQSYCLGFTCFKQLNLEYALVSYDPGRSRYLTVFNFDWQCDDGGVCVCGKTFNVVIDEKPSIIDAGSKYCF